MNETEELHNLVALLDGGVDPSNEQSASKLVQIMNALNSLSQADLDDLLQLLGMSPGAVRHLAENAQHHLASDKQYPCVNGFRHVPVEAALVQAGKKCAPAFSLAREIARGFRSSGKRMGKRQKTSASALAGNQSAAAVVGKQRGHRKKGDNPHADPSMWSTNQVQDMMAQIVAHRDKDRLRMDLDFD